MNDTLLWVADDLGLNSLSDENILRTCDSGPITQVGILPNGARFQEAIEDWKQRRDALTVTAHLNVVEGVPLCDSLLARNNSFRYSFVTLWLSGMMGRRSKKQAFHDALKRELSAQLRRVSEAVGGVPFSVDSHQHTHHIPCVRDALLAVIGDYPVSRVRVAREPWYWSFERGILRRYTINMVKHCLLKLLSHKLDLELRRLGIDSHDMFVGLLDSGQMTLRAVKKAVAAGRQSARNQHLRFEILFHPGYAGSCEQKFSSFYSSKRRLSELQELTERYVI